MKSTLNIGAWLAAVPPALWVAVTVASILLTAITLSAARRRVRRAGQRLTDPGTAATWRARDTMLTVASLVPAALFWLMVLAGSLHGLVAFGRSTLGWHDGWEYLVPGTLDGVSVTFAMLAFRAVRRQKTPDRCYRVAWGAALSSATINFAHEYDTSGNALAGGYLGLLSLFGMVMFDELLSQFEEGTASVRRENPKFGIRWVTWPSNTFLAAVAWRNHPRAEGTPGTVSNAVANLKRVRGISRQPDGPGVRRTVATRPLIGWSPQCGVRSAARWSLVVRSGFRHRTSWQHRRWRGPYKWRRHVGGVAVTITCRYRRPRRRSWSGQTLGFRCVSRQPWPRRLSGRTARHDSTSTVQPDSYATSGTPW